MRKVIITALCLFVFMTGCATGPQKKWYHSSKSEGDYNQDSYACQQDASLYAASKKGSAHLELTYSEIMQGSLIGDQKVLEQKRFRQCMEAKGYELR
jgi:hypothetical protein